MTNKANFAAKLLATVTICTQLQTSVSAASLTPASVSTTPSASGGAPDPAPVDPVAAKAAAKAKATQLAQWKRDYGDGPYPDEVAAYAATKPEPLRPYYKTLYTQGERNAVLNFERLGLAAMQTQNWADAEHAFDAALSRIEAVYGKNKQADAAKSVFRKEANKSFKGEPYERAMAYYYRGILYLRVGDFDNARASFRDAEYQDTQSDQEEYQSDFALLDYLNGWSSHCAGQNNEAADAYKAAIKSNGKIAVPAANANALMIVEYGNGPVKAKDGAQKEKLVFNPGASAPEVGASFELVNAPGTPMPALPISSIYTQASTRGGRAIDGILAGKANWKSGTESFGNAAVMGGMNMMNQAQLNPSQAGMANAGGYMALAGLLFSAASSAMKADADTRMWDTLPDQIGIATMHAPAGNWAVNVAYTGANGRLDLKPAAIMQATAKTCSVTWVRTHDALGAPAEAPGDVGDVAKALAKHKDIAAQNKIFRTSLASN